MSYRGLFLMLGWWWDIEIGGIGGMVGGCWHDRGKLWESRKRKARNHAFLNVG